MSDNMGKDLPNIAASAQGKLISQEGDDQHLS